MLDELIVTNLGLIESAHVEPGAGLVVVTGETGTGKTLLLGALRLLSGGQARKDLVGPAGDEAVVQARFTLDDEEVTVARRISAAGRSRGYLDGLASPVKTLAERTEGVVEIIAQHDHLQLTRSAYVRTMLDAALDDEGRLALDAYAAAWDELDRVRDRERALGGDRRALERELATVRHQADEIADAGFVDGEDVELASRAARLRNGRAIVESLQEAAAALGEEGVEPWVDRALTALDRVGELDTSLAGLASQAADLASLISDLRTEVARSVASDDEDESSLADVEARLAVLGNLRRRYGDTLVEVLEFGVSAERRAAELTSLLAEADTLEKDRLVAEEAVTSAGAALSRARSAAGVRLATDAVGHLVELGFSDPVVEFACAPTAPGPTGADRIELRFASDRGLETGPVGRIASGGELSRLVLALRLAGGTGDATVAAFDEIDAGVGGTVAGTSATPATCLSMSCRIVLPCMSTLFSVQQTSTWFWVRAAACSKLRCNDG